MKTKGGQEVIKSRRRKVESAFLSDE